MKAKNKENFIEILKLIGVGLLAGFVNGFFGAGGGLLLVPMIELVRQGDSKTAHATTLGCVLVMCLASSVVYFVKRQIDFRLWLVCGIGSLVGSFVGTKLLKKLKNNIVDFLFSIVLILAGVSMMIF